MRILNSFDARSKGHASAISRKLEASGTVLRPRQGRTTPKTLAKHHFGVENCPFSTSLHRFSSFFLHRPGAERDPRPAKPSRRPRPADPSRCAVRALAGSRRAARERRRCGNSLTFPSCSMVFTFFSMVFASFLVVFAAFCIILHLFSHRNDASRGLKGPERVPGSRLQPCGGRSRSAAADSRALSGRREALQGPVGSLGPHPSPMSLRSQAASIYELTTSRFRREITKKRPKN